MSAIRVSVCMATYNGERYLAPQLESILAELEPQDEVVVVDDASTDGTVAVLEGFDDPRIRVHARGDNRGYVRTFEEALGRATGDVVMLSDQDDVWIPGRRALFLAALEDSAVAASNLVLLGSDDPLPNPITRRPWRLRATWSRQGVRNALRILAGMAPYYGCAMAVRRDALDVFAALGRAQGRRCSSVVGDAPAVLGLWDRLASAWGAVREIRADQPSMVIDHEPALAPDPAVRRSAPDEYDLVLPACVRMFTEEDRKSVV